MRTRKQSVRLIPLLLTLLLVAHAHVAFGTDPGDTLWGAHLIFEPGFGLRDVALARDGTLYAYSLTGHLYAVNPGGGLKWEYDTGSVISTCLAIRYAPPGENPQHDGTVYVGLADGRVLAVNPQGGLEWTFQAGCTVSGAPAIAKDGTIYVGSRSSALFAINPSGTLKWVFETIETAGVEDPVVGPDGTIYFGTFWEDRFYAVNPDGSLKWAVELEDPVTTSPAIATGGIIYVGARSKLYSLYSWGAVRWAVQLYGQVDSSPAIGADGTIYIGADTLVAYNPDGSEKWHFQHDGKFPGVYVSSPAVDSNGTIYFGSLDEYLYAVHPDGSFYWRCDTHEQVHSSPIIGDDGTLYMNTLTHVIAFYTGSSGLANSTWPMYRHDPERSGRLDKFWIILTDTLKLLHRVVLMDLPTGIKRSLVAKLESAVRSLERGHIRPAMHKLAAFIHQVEAQKGKKIPEREADVLIRDALHILSLADGDHPWRRPCRHRCGGGRKPHRFAPCRRPRPPLRHRGQHHDAVSGRFRCHSARIHEASWELEQ